MRSSLSSFAFFTLLFLFPHAHAQAGSSSEAFPGGDDVTVTLKEIDLEEAIQEFQKFQSELDNFREEVQKGQKTAQDIASIIKDLRVNASPENNHNEVPILNALGTYVDEVLGRKIELVDFLESQRYRIAYYATKMAASIKPQDVALLFGNPAQNELTIRRKAESVAGVEQDIRSLVDELATTNEFSKETFQPLPGMTDESRRKLAKLEFRYQNEKNSLEFAKSRMRILEESSNTTKVIGPGGELNIDLLLTQMFGALDRIQLQMNADLYQLENFLGLYEHSSRAHDVLQAFEQLIAMQGGIEGPSQGLTSVLEWLQDSSTQKLELGINEVATGEGAFPRSSDLLREAYINAAGERVQKSTN